MKKAVINYQKTTGIAREEQIYENRIYRMRKYGFCHDQWYAEKGLYKKDEIIVSNLTEEGSKRSREKLGVVTTLDNHEVVKNTKLVFLAVKPQFYEEVLNEVKDELTPEHTVVGIAPGKTLAWLEEKCGQPLKVVRMMPNTPAQVGEGMTGVCANEKVSAEELAQICEITDSFGRTEVGSGASDGRSKCCKRMFTCICFYVHRSNGRCCSSPGNAKKTGLSVCCTGFTWKRKNGTGNRHASGRTEGYGMFTGRKYHRGSKNPGTEGIQKCCL